MNIAVNRKVFLAALNDVAPFANPRNVIPILKYAKITTKGNRIKVEANDSKSGLTKYIEAEKIDEEGSFLVNVNEVAKYISALSDEVLVISIDGASISIPHLKGEGVFQSEEVGDYPSFKKDGDAIKEFVIPTGLLSEYISMSRDFVDYNETRPVLQAMYAFVKDGKFGFCATDTHKLICGSNPIDSTEEVSWLIIPTVAAALKKACTATDEISVRLFENHHSYRIENTIIDTVKMNGNFPNFERVVPKQWNIECTVDAEDMVKSLKRLSMFSDESDCMKLNISPMDMVMSVDNIAGSKNASENVVHNGCNGNIKIGFSVSNALSSFSIFGSNEVVIGLSDPGRPALIKKYGENGCMVVLMPMVIQN